MPELFQANQEEGADKVVANTEKLEEDLDTDDYTESEILDMQENLQEVAQKINDAVDNSKGSEGTKDAVIRKFTKKANEVYNESESMTQIMEDIGNETAIVLGIADKKILGKYLKTNTADKNSDIVKGQIFLGGGEMFKNGLNRLIGRGEG